MDPQDLVRFIHVDRIPFALLVLVVGVVVVRFSARFLDQLGERFTDRRLLLKKVAALSRFFIYLLIVVIISTSVLALESEALLAVAGSIGVAVGFAFKDLLASVIAGVILLMDQPFQVGDRVTFGTYYGEVKEIGLRSVRVVTLDDNLVTIPNALFLSEAVASANAGQLDAMVVVPFYIAAAEDYEKAQEIVREAALTSAYVYVEKPVVTLVSDEFLGERFVTIIRLKAYVFDARYEKAFSSDITRRVKSAFRSSEIRGPDIAYRDLDLNHGVETLMDIATVPGPPPAQ
ncbi:MAG: mechanosensitive ion channel [Deltaproteobacteria bacterium]|nr:mechanosensitive ion channel [Deltaproteobacteria bacterium]